MIAKLVAINFESSLAMNSESERENEIVGGSELYLLLKKKENK